MAREFILFDRQLVIDDAFLLDIHLRRKIVQYAESAKNDFSEYYQKLGGMEALIKDGKNSAVNIIKKYAQQCVKWLASIGIYSVSAMDLIQSMVYQKKGYTFDQVFEDLCDWYSSKQKEEARKDAERTARRQNRAKWVGGGFGLGNAIVGAAQAGAMNLASGAVHGAVNLVGKGISSMDAAMSESAMFSRAETRERLANALYLDVFDLVYVMERTIKTANIAIRPITPTDERKAGSLFENLKTLNLDYAQAYDVAFQIFQTNPSEYEYYEYCMKRFSYQQPNLIQIGEYCQVDLSKITESIFEQIFSQMPHETEEETLRLHEKLIEKKNELGVSRSATIDKVAKMLRDFDVAARTFHNVTYNTRELRAKAEADYHQLAAICAKIGEANEAECNRLKEEISGKDYVEQVLQPFLDQIRSRIEEIWAAEDGQIFDNILINTDIQNRDAVIASIAYISSSGRTGAKNQYIDALNGFNEKNIQLAREYQIWGKKTLWQKYLLPVLLGVVGFLSTPALGPFGLLACAAGIVWLIWALVKSKRTKTAWELLTVHGTAIHPVLIISPDEAK